VHKIARESRFSGKVAQLQNPLAVRLRDLLVRAVPERMMERQLVAILDFEPEPMKRAA
jgi:hypothetical protein